MDSTNYAAISGARYSATSEMDFAEQREAFVSAAFAWKRSMLRSVGIEFDKRHWKATTVYLRRYALKSHGIIREIRFGKSLNASLENF